MGDLQTGFLNENEELENEMALFAREEGGSFIDGALNSTEYFILI